jgi:hypothetical protein
MDHRGRLTQVAGRSWIAFATTRLSLIDGTFRRLSTEGDV